MNHLHKINEKELDFIANTNPLMELQTFITDFGLVPVDDQTTRFTWTNKRAGNDNIMEKFDKVFVNAKFMELFPGSQVRYLPSFKSDHKPTQWDLTPDFKNVVYPFKFHAMWLDNRDYDNVIYENWCSNNLFDPDILLDSNL